MCLTWLSTLRARLGKNKKRLVSIGLAVLIVAGISGFVFFKHVKKAEAGWWPGEGTSWLQRKQLTLTNNSGATLNSTAVVAITVNTKALYDSGYLQSGCNDLRIVYQPSSSQATELTRYVSYPSGATCSTSTATKVNFPLQVALANAASSTDYYIYYKNPDATAPSNTDNAFDIGAKDALLVCPFDGTTTCAAGETPTTESGAIRYSGSKSAMSFDGSNDAVTIGHISGDDGSAITVEAWTYIKDDDNSTGTDYAQGIVNATQLFSGDSSTATFGITEFHQNNNAEFIQGTIVVNDTLYILQQFPFSSFNQWIHVALTYDGSVIRLFINGALVSSENATGTIDATSGGWEVGASNNKLNGIVDEVRISKIARYTANFTPSTAPFVRDSNTLVLLHFDENGDDPRNTGKAIDDSGNGNHGTITGAKYVAGLVGVDASTSDTGNVPRQSYAGHEGVFIEEGTTNKITNPSFDHATYNTNWGDTATTFNYSSAATTFTPSMAKRNSAGPFAAGVNAQGDLVNASSLTDDVLSFSYGTQVNGNFYTNFDTTQGAVAFWWTPEYSYDASAGSGLHYLWYVNSNYYLAYNYANDRYELKIGGQTVNSSSNIAAGTTYNLVSSWDTKNVLSGSNYICFTINDGVAACGTTQPTVSAPASTLYVGSNGTTGASSGIIEGLTVYRRPLYDGTNGINAGNGDEINLIYAAAAGKDPTLVTGSWDVVFDLPTNASTGSLATGTGNAWSHPHSSNLLYTSTTNTGGFMMNGTYTSDGWADEGTPTSVGALSASEKIFSGGYKFVSDAANEGIYYDKTVVAGNDWVVRALAHSDGTSIPKIILYDQTNGAEIGSLTGTTTSTRSAPDVFIFTGEAPAGETTLRVKLVNTASSGTTYWHQVEVLANLLTNPSFATGSGDPWIPTGWGNSGLSAEEGVQETTTVHSGTSAFKLNGNAFEGIGQTFSSTNGSFFGIGMWGNGVSGGEKRFQIGSGLNDQASNTTDIVVEIGTGSWNRYTRVVRGNSNTSQANLQARVNGTAVSVYDDYYSVALTSISLTVTPASLANSTETSGIRVDGTDTLTQTISGITTTAGTIKLAYTPRHSAATQALFGVATPYIFHAYNSANDYIALYWSAANTLKLEYNMNGGGTTSGTWDATGAIVANTSYILQVDYTGSGSMTLAVDGTTRITLSSIPAAFGAAPSTMYWGSKNDGTLQADATITIPITPTESTTAPYYKFGSKSAKLVAFGNANYIISINAGNTNPHALSAYVYDGTSGNVGGTVSATVANWFLTVRLSRRPLTRIWAGAGGD